MDVSSWAIPTENAVLKKIKEKTGISIRFVTPVQDDGQKLSTMIAGGDLPDVISVPTSKTQTLASLAQQGYVYDIDTLQKNGRLRLKSICPRTYTIGGRTAIIKSTVFRTTIIVTKIFPKANNFSRTAA